jgi:single-strand DNA-binding protein
MARSLNKVQLIGRLGRDPEMKYTQNGTALTTFSVATNRTWTNDDGTPHEEVDWHLITAWGVLAEHCNQYLGKGRLVYLEGRLQTRTWETDDGAKRSKTEIVADTVLFLDRDPANDADEPVGEELVPEQPPTATAPRRAAGPRR